MTFSKYSNKCITHVKNNLIYNIQPFEHPLFDILKNIYSVNDTYKYDITKQKILKKLHMINEYPLLYMHYLETSDEQLSFKDFYEKYNSKYDDIFNKKSKVKDILDNPINERIKLHENIYNSNFVSMDIQQLSEISEIKYTEINFKNHKIYLYECDKKLNVEFIIFIMNFMFHLADAFKIKYNSLNLTLFTCSQKKLFTNTPYLGPENINSGMSYDNNIFIWRREEIYKVLIHEMIHYFGFDRKLFYKSLKSRQNNFHCITGDDRNNEAYTETFALIIHTYILSKLLDESFFDLFNYEVNFSLIQCNKILNFFNIKDINELLFNDIDKENKTCTNKINQKTSVFSYFFIKTAFIINLKSIMDYIHNNKQDNYENIIEHSLNNNIFIDMMHKIKNTNINTDSKTFIHNTLRMTCLEIN